MSDHSPVQDPSRTVGGQAVIEGVMMRAPTAWAVAVRTPNGGIEAVRHELPRLSSRSRLARIPFVRGVMVLGESLTLGFRALSWSAQMAAGEEEDPLTTRQIVGTMALALVLFSGIFLVLPAVAAKAVTESGLGFNLLEGVIRLGLFVAYVWAIGRSQEIARVFRYHGAEHMTIHAYEAGDPLNVESVRRYPPEHPRCGTSFLLLVVVLSILVFSLLGRPGWLVLVASRVLLIPVIAGISYEVLRWSGTRRSDLAARILARPGLWLQKLTTGRPSPDMVEVAICSLLSALDEPEVEEVLQRGPVAEQALASRAAAAGRHPAEEPRPAAPGEDG